MKNLRFAEQKGAAPIFILIVMLILAIALPIATKLVQQNQETRSKAASNCVNGICSTTSASVVVGATQECVSKYGPGSSCKNICGTNEVKSGTTDNCKLGSEGINFVCCTVVGATTECVSTYGPGSSCKNICGTNEVKSGTTGKCKPGSEGINFVCCTPGASSSGGCKGDTDCPNYQICTSSKCVASHEGYGCARDTQCPSTMKCISGKCAPSSGGSSVCTGTEQRCNGNQPQICSSGSWSSKGSPCVTGATSSNVCKIVTNGVAECRDSCTTSGDKRCSGNFAQICGNGFWGSTDNCDTKGKVCSVKDGCVAPTSATCTYFTYSGWSTCTNNNRTRSVATQAPAGCIGGSPVLSESCTVACVEDDWSSTLSPTICPSTGTQTKTWTKKAGVTCSEGVSHTTETTGCTYTPTAVCTNGQQKCVTGNKYVTCTSGQWGITQTACTGTCDVNAAPSSNICVDPVASIPKINIEFAVSGVKSLATSTCFGSPVFSINVVKAADPSISLTNNSVTAVALSRTNVNGDQIFKITDLALNDKFTSNDKIIVNIKRDKLLATAYIKNGQTGPMSTQDLGPISTVLDGEGSKTLDFSGYPVLNGDIGGEGDITKSDGFIDAFDFSHWKNQWAESKFGPGQRADLNGDCSVDASDLLIYQKSLKQKAASSNY